MGQNVITLIGGLSLVQSQISQKAMLRTFRKEKQGFWVDVNKSECAIKENSEQEGPEIPLFLAVRSKGLCLQIQPPRGREHTIQLK